jgi:hypothetical protein
MAISTSRRCSTNCWPPATKLAGGKPSRTRPWRPAMSMRKRATTPCARCSTRGLK